MIRSAVVLSFLLFARAPALAADASPFDGMTGLKFEYYPVEGRTAAEIYASMRARAPRDGGDGQGLGRTAWRSEAHWRESHRGSRCTVSDPTMKMSITILLPRLATREGVTREGWAFWRSSIRGLEIHEAGHARIAWNHRDDFRRAAQGASCGSVNRIAQKVQARIGALQQAYDRDTDHGQKQMPPIER